MDEFNVSLMETLNSSLEANNSEPFQPYVERPETYIVPLLFALIFIIGVVGNGTLVAVFVRHKAMRNVPNTRQIQPGPPLFLTSGAQINISKALLDSAPQREGGEYFEFINSKIFIVTRKNLLKGNSSFVVDISIKFASLPTQELAEDWRNTTAELDASILDTKLTREWRMMNFIHKVDNTFM
ncbi:Neuropeptide receptor A15 [Operophtera brumata]|uniref:Neuropeptide receptor A15 n=1 Tax=Operophtera brumata TaxID=104452 RepID=A0A0L7L417_OPEBR|nr:Neuropeptide receptor A15 [Operophtera brumata]